MLSEDAMLRALQSSALFCGALMVGDFWKTRGVPLASVTGAFNPSCNIERAAVELSPKMTRAKMTAAGHSRKGRVGIIRDTVTSKDASVCYATPGQQRRSFEGVPA
jgi:hypothetical protein